MTAVIAELHDAKRSYGRRLALQIQHLSINEGECIAFSGENGAGKSTLLRVLCGNTRLTSGRFDTTPAWRRGAIAYCPQDGGVYGDLTIAENIKAMSRRVRLSPSGDLLEAFLSAANLHDVMDIQVRRLSGGFQKLASIATCLSLDAQILILDEPTSDLHSTYRTAVANTLSLAKSRYLAMLIADHAPEMIGIADRSIELGL